MFRQTNIPIVCVYMCVFELPCPWECLLAGLCVASGQRLDLHELMEVRDGEAGLGWFSPL